MSSPEVLELLRKKEKSTGEAAEALSKFQSQVEQILGESKLLIPASVLDGLVQSFRDSLRSVLEVKAAEYAGDMAEIVEILRQHEQMEDVNQKILDILVEIRGYLTKKNENAELERQVLQQVKGKLG